MGIIKFGKTTEARKYKELKVKSLRLKVENRYFIKIDIS